MKINDTLEVKRFLNKYYIYCENCTFEINESMNDIIKHFADVKFSRKELGLYISKNFEIDDSEINQLIQECLNLLIFVEG